MYQPRNVGRVVSRGVRQVVLVTLAALMITTTTGAVAYDTSAHQAGLSLSVLGTRADLVSGDEARVLVGVPAGIPRAQVRLSLDGRDLSSGLEVRSDGNLEVLVTGLPRGYSTLLAMAPDIAGARLRLTNHPASGPVISGAPVEPWTCLAGARNAGCERPPSYFYKYMPVVGTDFQPYDPSSPPPSGTVATTTTDRGVTVPYIIRVETGTLDRSSYQIAVLAVPGRPWTAYQPQPTWNHKLEIPGDASCGSVHGESPPGDPLVLDDLRLKRGYMVASPSLADNGQNCDVVVQAESLMMLKERIVERYGDIRYTIGAGCSGGSIFQLQSENAYPGLFDGLITVCSFPDIWSTFTETEDCALLRAFFQNNQSFTEAQQAAVAGHVSSGLCRSWVDVYGFNRDLDPASAGSPSNCGVPVDKVYNPANNPHGVRCSVQDYAVGQFGRRATDGFAGRPYDNVGVAYGLAALKAGAITPTQFVALNAGIGSHDIDYRPQASRVRADDLALKTAYQGGFVNDFSHLGDVPIIDIRGHDNAEIHHDFYSHSERGRLEAAYGDTHNLVTWTGPVPLLADATLAKGPVGDLQVLILDPPFQLMDQWLTNIEQDQSARTKRQKVLADRPAAATNACFDGTGQRIEDPKVCLSLYPTDFSPRVVAGGKLTNDTLKCSLKPLARNDFSPAVFSDPEWTELRAAFPAGVCDFRLRGPRQTATRSWSTYADGPGGRALGAAPVFSAVSASRHPSAQPNSTSQNAGGWLPTSGGSTGLVEVGLLVLLAGAAAALTGSKRVVWDIADFQAPRPWFVPRSPPG